MVGLPEGGPELNQVEPETVPGSSGFSEDFPVVVCEAYQGQIRRMADEE
jgi:hypothetical protein